MSLFQRQTTGRSLAVVAALAVLAPGAAWARSGGISGFSGLGGSDCSACHSGGTAPQVTMSGPETLQPGATGEYTVTITGGPATQAGVDVAANGGATLQATDASTKLSNGEVVHSAPVAFSGNSASFTFSAQAPDAPGQFSLFAGAASTNGSATSGDGTAHTTLAVTVEAGGGGEDAGAHEPPGQDAAQPEPAGPDAGQAEAADAGAPPTGGADAAQPAEAQADAGAVAEQPGADAGAQATAPTPTGEGGGGCSAASVGSIIAPLALGAGLLFARRRQRLARAGA